MKTWPWIAIRAALAAAPASAQIEYFEKFDGGANLGGWTFGAPAQAIQPSGGSPGAYFRSSPFNVATPFVGTGVGVSSPFVGNYRAAGSAIMFRVYLRVFASDLPVVGRVPAIILYNDSGTPGNTQDDWGAWASLLSPLSAQWWGYTVYSVNTQSATPPSGWNMVDFGPSPPSNRSWDILIQDVDRLMFSYGSPTATPAAQNWDIGIDDILITSISNPVCYANCDRSTMPPCLNVNDFVCFTSQYATATAYSNCDFSTIPPILNVNDFNCFMGHFAAGCGLSNCQ